MKHSTAAAAHNAAEVVDTVWCSQTEPAGSTLAATAANGLEKHWCHAAIEQDLSGRLLNPKQLQHAGLQHALLCVISLTTTSTRWVLAARINAFSPLHSSHSCPRQPSIQLVLFVRPLTLLQQLERSCGQAWGTPLLLRRTVSLQSWQPSPHLQAKLPLALLGDSTSCHICGGGSSNVCGGCSNIRRGCSHVCWCLLDHHGLCSNDSLRLLDHHGLCSHNGLYWLLDHHGLLLVHHLLGLCCHNGLRLGGHNLDGHRDLATAVGSGSREQQQRQRGQGAGNHSRGRGEGRGRAGWNRETQHAVLLGWVTVCRLHQAAAN